MAVSGFYTKQIGALIRLDTEDNETLLAAATVLEIYCKRPSGAIVTWTASLSGTKVTYTTTAITDLPEVGNYTLQAHLEGPGWSLVGKTVTMSVGKAIK